MGKHMTQDDVSSVEALARKPGATPTSVIEELADCRKKKRLDPLSESAIRRVLRGEAYQRGKLETRGRKKKLTKKVIKTFETSRLQCQIATC